MAKIINIIQARMGSTRFPGKMLANLHGSPVIDWVVKRSLCSKYVDSTYLATSILDRDNPLANRVEGLCEVYRGSESDVLSRYADITKKEKADLVVRVCGDRPLVDSVLIDQAVEFMLKNVDVDLAYNHISGGCELWPRGFGVEIIKAEHLIKMDSTLNDSYSREHVTPFIWQNPDRFNLVALLCPKQLDCGIPDIECDLDTKEDLKLIESISDSLGMYADAQAYFENWKKQFLKNYHAT